MVETGVLLIVENLQAVFSKKSKLQTSCFPFLSPRDVSII